MTVNNFLVDGGDGFTVFLQGQNRRGAATTSWPSPTGGDATPGAHAPVAPPATDRINELP